MVEETTYQPRVAPIATPGLPQAGADAFGAGVGGAVTQFNETQHQVALRAYKIDRQQVADSEAAAAAAEGAKRRLENERAIEALRRENPDAGAAGHSAAVEKMLASQRERVGANITENSVRQRVVAQFDDYASQIAIRENQYEQGKRLGKKVADDVIATYTMRNIIMTSSDPETVSRELRLRLQEIEGSDLPADVKAVQTRAAEAAAFQGQLDGLLTRQQPQGVAALIDSGALNAVLTPEQLAHYRSRADIGMRQQAVAAEREKAQAEIAQKEAEATALGDIGRGVVVDPQRLASMASAAEARGDTSRAHELRAAAAANAETQVYGDGRALPAQITARMGLIEQQKDWRSDANLVARHAQLEKLREQARNAEPNYAPLSFSDPAAVQQRVSEARQWAATHNGQLYLLGKDQAAELGNLASSGPKGRAQVAAVLSMLPGVAKVKAVDEVAKGDDALRQAVLLPVPQLRNELFAGEELRKGNSALVPTKETMARWGERGRMAMRLAPPAAQNAVLAGAMNVYAYRAAQKGLTEFDEKLWDGVVNDMVAPSGGGGIGTFNAQPVILPAKMDQREFDARLANLPDNFGAYRADGKTAISRSELLAGFTPVSIDREGAYRWVDKAGRYARGKRGGFFELNVRAVPLPTLSPVAASKPQTPVYVAAPAMQQQRGPVYVGPVAEPVRR